jgi:hypothetical protein
MISGCTDLVPEHDELASTHGILGLFMQEDF